jgi:hypothetical protein
MERLLCAAKAARAAIGLDDTPILANCLCAVEIEPLAVLVAAHIRGLSGSDYQII